MGDVLLRMIYNKVYDEGYFEKYLTLYLLDVPTEAQLIKSDASLLQSDENCSLIIARGFDDNIKVNATFDAIISQNNIKTSIFTRAILKYISVNPSYKIDYLPKGYSGLCLLNFPQGKPDILKNIPVYGENKDYEKHDILILTQRAVLERIFDEYNDFSQY
ncbi:MAG TPA: hypothetical protein VIM65_12765 [Cyclobacteriaceae bacterium]